MISSSGNLDVALLLDGEREVDKKSKWISWPLTWHFDASSGEHSLEKLLQACRIATLTDTEVYFFCSGDETTQITPYNEMRALQHLRRVVEQSMPASALHSEGALCAAVDALATQFVQRDALLDQRVQELESDASVVGIRQWLAQQGAYIHEEVVVANFVQSSGRGLMARRDIKANTALFRIPEHLLINLDTLSAIATSNAAAAAVLEIEGIDESTTLLLFVLHEWFVAGADSFWKPYFDSVPLDLPSPLLDTNALAHTDLEAEATILRNELTRIHTLLFPTLNDYYPSLFPRDHTTLTHFLRAHALFDSRALKIQLDSHLRITLCPFVDLLNLSPHPSIAKRHFNPQQRVFEMQLLGSVLPHQEITLSYGRLDSSELALSYGFLLPTVNPYDHIAVALPEPPSDAHTRLMATLSLSRHHLIRSDGYFPPALLHTIALCAVEEQSLAWFRLPLPARHTANALRRLTSTLTDLLTALDVNGVSLSPLAKAYVATRRRILTAALTHCAHM